jgi:hypothetical protein
MILPCGQHGERWASGAVDTGQYDQAEHASRHLDRAPDYESGRLAFQSFPVASRSLVMSLVIVPRATRVNVWILRRSPPRPAVSVLACLVAYRGFQRVNVSSFCCEWMWSLAGDQVCSSQKAGLSGNDNRNWVGPEEVSRG